VTCYLEILVVFLSFKLIKVIFIFVFYRIIVDYCNCTEVAALKAFGSTNYNGRQR